MTGAGAGGPGLPDPDELRQGPDRVPAWTRLVGSSPRWVRIASAVLLAIAAVTVVADQTRGGAPSSVHPTASPTTLPPVGESYFGVGTICPPVTDHVHTLVVSFTLTNVTNASATVVRITPVLPLGGLESVAIDIAGGSCGDHAGAPSGLEVEPGMSLLVTFRLLLPTTCPKPLPVQARVDVRTQAAVLTDVVPLYPDLGSIEFDACPAAG